MKKRMKQLTAAVMAVAMLFSLATVASASTVPGTTDITSISSTPSGGSSTGNQVTNQGGLPTDVINIVMPTAPAQAFSLLFDSHKLLSATNWNRYNPENDGEGITPPAAGTLFFKNVTKTAKDVTEALTGAVTGTTLAAGDKVVKYAKATSSAIYALRVDDAVNGETDGKVFQKWITATGADVDFTAATYTAIAGIKLLDPTSGAGQDAIDKINADSFVDFKRTKTAAETLADTNITGDASGMEEYSFNSYSDSDFRWVGVDETDPDNPAHKVLSALSGTLDSTNTTVSALETAGYVKQQENKGIVSYAKTSSPIKVINKSNKTIGVSLTAELSGVPGGDGSVSGEGAAAHQTYVYANSMGTGTDAGKFYSDQKDTDGNLIEIKDLPVIYMELSNGTDTEVMTYADSKGSVNISTVIPGKDDFFSKQWIPNLNTTDDLLDGSYKYALDKTKRETDFDSMTFQLSGVINESGVDDTWWDNLGATPDTVPTLDVTWQVKSYTALKSVEIALNSKFSLSKGGDIDVSANPDNAVVDSVKVNGEDIAFTSTEDSTTGGTTKITITKAALTGLTAPVTFKVTFKDPTDAIRKVTAQATLAA